MIKVINLSDKEYDGESIYEENESLPEYIFVPTQFWHELVQIEKERDKMLEEKVPDHVREAARYFKEQGGHIGGLGNSRAANILWDYINYTLAKPKNSDQIQGEK